LVKSGDYNWLGRWVRYGEVTFGNIPRSGSVRDLKMDSYNIFSPVEIDPETDASKKMRAAATAVWGYPLENDRFAEYQDTAFFPRP